MVYVRLLIIGLSAGMLAGMFGIGGGLIVAPALLFVVKMNELEALGTNLAALIPPTGLPGAMEYCRNGLVNVKSASLVALGIFPGAWFGARLVIGLPPGVIRRVYAAFLIVIAPRMRAPGR